MLKRFLASLPLALLLTACSDSSNDSAPGTSNAVTPQYDFTPASQWLEGFVRDEELFDGAGLIVVSAEHGILHTESFGNHTPDMVYLLASVSKVPSVSLLMALASDPDVDLDIDTPIENYLPWEGVYPGITTVQLLSNTSGIPGLLQTFAGGYGAHNCQYALPGDFPNAESLQACSQAIYQTALDNSNPPGTVFDYGGSQWQLAGGLAEVVGGDSWANLFRQYIAEPCELEVFEYGNMFSDTAAWTGNPDSLRGRDNPNIEGGGIANLNDIAVLLRMHLNDGRCGDQQVMAASLAQRMRVDIGTELGSRDWVGSDGRGYGIGWWIPQDSAVREPTLFVDGGAFGSVSWIDTGRGYGAFVALAKYDNIVEARRGPARINPEFIPIMDAIMDNPL